MARGLIAICLITLLACSSVEGRGLELAHLNGAEHQSVGDHVHGVVENVTVGGFNLQLNLSNPKLVEELKIKRSDFPSDFMFGAATSAAQEQQKGEVGIVLASQYYLPYTQLKEDKAATGRLFDFYLGW
ncbi:hypothetical protein C1H46_027957 [Malus baccata]|uniref:Uncharacterized protein n=1 Tax=Malus baccata TaxID=106549 RepID=A0A540LJ16_MALBA|nr:hypothetical protein C1H46_027957 [Malus baccata]